MGSFSWRSCKSGRAIPHDARVTLLMPNNEVIRGTYRDYGIISSKGKEIDVFVLHGVNYDIKEAARLTAFQDDGYDTPDYKAYDEARSIGIFAEHPYPVIDLPFKDGEEFWEHRIRTDRERENARYWQASGCGFRFFRGHEYEPGMKYEDFPASYGCMDQGCVPLWDKSVDPRWAINEFNRKMDQDFAQIYADIKKFNEEYDKKHKKK